jgi:hypothetical protein
MKRLFLVLLLACVTGVAGYEVFCKIRPENQKFDCEIKWLSHKLALTPEQAARVRAAHVKYCPSMNGLGAEYKSCSDPQRVGELKKTCKDSANKLVEAVCAELTPPQREEYLKLLEARKQRQQQAAPPPPK